MIHAKFISSLEKCFIDEEVFQKTELKSISMLRNERLSFQICYEMEEKVRPSRDCKLKIESPLAQYITVYNVRQIPSYMPAFPEQADDNYLRTAPGLYPDLLEPFSYKTDCLCPDNTLRAVWFEVDPKCNLEAGIYPFRVRFYNRKKKKTEVDITLQVEIINAELPAPDLKYTQWFYTDCLMDRYGVRVWSEKHWKIIESFMQNAVRYGQNMILTPIVTPELDTYKGGYRPTTQLVDVTKTDDGYTFDFSNLGRWVDLCDKMGIHYLEICHLYSQWGAKACPKVMATVNGKKKRIFGWDTPSDGDEYKAFLSALIPQMLTYLKEQKNGADKRCWFHISDEPSDKDLDQYKKLSDFLAPLLEGYPVMDALSNVEYYDNGLVKNPVPYTGHIDEFLERDIEDRWSYYCGAGPKLSNRAIAQPSARNRIIGLQFYKFNIKGFLHWGYNNYNTRLAYAKINPFLFSDGDGWVPSGDTYSVYPGENGKPWPSLRQPVFYDALQDLRALQLLESLCGREETMALLEAGIEPITFKNYPKSAQWLLNLRERINRKIKENV
ncbi:MAG: DUF4091 domain-containing protein [Clostridia bacterium]|nr:DUF4091 domain-containing protein [Clostridia bacterium]